ncbi:MAG: hypothetical protein ACPGVB_08775 [Chitinophagales bacterium]
MKQLLTIITFLSLGLYCYAQNTVGTFSGDGTAGLENGTPDSSRFNQPFGICRDAVGNLFIADGGNHCIRKIDKNGVSSIHAGTTEAVQFNNHAVRLIHLDIISSIQGIFSDFEDLEIFPNPSKDKINVHLEKWEKSI